MVSNLEAIKLNNGLKIKKIEEEIANKLKIHYEQEINLLQEKILNL